jgi:release factor glutamine methyltransferase
MGATLDSDVVARLDELVARRETREPLQHITGQAPFRYLVLDVGPGVLVPRPETELVAEWAIEALMQVPNPSPIAVDLGTGTGALALALATEVPHSRVFAVEKFAPALEWATRNIDRLGDGRVTLVTADASDALSELDGTVDVVVTNPPYIPDTERPIDTEVLGYDPESALFWRKRWTSRYPHLCSDRSEVVAHRRSARARARRRPGAGGPRDRARRWVSLTDNTFRPPSTRTGPHRNALGGDG